MGSPTTERNGIQRAFFLTLCMLLATLPLSHVQAVDMGDPNNLQAQGIQATFDSTTETTVVTWQNIDSSGTELNSMFSATYNLYRHTSGIDAMNVGTLTPFATVPVCDVGDASQNPFNCRASSHAGHSVAYLVPPGTNGTFFYAITTTLSNGTEAGEFIIDGAHIEFPVTETTTAVYTPYILAVDFDASSSQTTINWVNYNTFSQTLPETGSDALTIRIWQTDYQMTRLLGPSLLTSETPIAELDASVTSYVVDVPAETQRSSYYSITYLLPNYSQPGVNYEDVRFLAQNTMSEPVVEDNLPPAQPTLFTAEFEADPLTGSGYTNISWGDSPAEEGETYRVYRSDQPFSTILRNDVELIVKDILEGIGSYQIPVPQGFLGYSYYCVVTVDENGVINTATDGSSCTGSIEENAFYNWVAEPTNVNAEFLGDRTTRVTWNDQMGVEGEIYHIWHGTYRVSGSQFVENQSLQWLGTVSDGVGSFDVEIPDDELRTNQFYFVTSEALYGNVNGTYHYTQLVQNYAQVLFEDTRAPNPPRIKQAYTIGADNLVSLEWFNEDEMNESYAIWRHYGEPFGVDENDISNIQGDGWEIVLDDIETNDFTSETLVRQFLIPSNVDRDVWYAITITDEWGNFNSEIYAGFGANAFKVSEDTLLPNSTISIFDSDGIPYESTTLVAGQYSMRIQVNEDLSTTPTINITTVAGAQLTDFEEPLTELNNNANNDNLGPLYSFEFSVLSNTDAGAMVIEVTMKDESENEVNQFWDHLSIDAQIPKITIFAPSSGDDGSKYLYGNRINVLAGVDDDVVVTSFQYRFTYHFGGVTGSAVSTPWADLTGVTDINGDNSSLTADMEVNTGNFEPGYHALYIRATDGAGNDLQEQVKFTVDFCRNRLDGTTFCAHEEALQAEPEPEVIKPSFTDPPYVVVWIIAVINILAIFLSLLVIRTSMAGPKKKKSGDEEEDDDWMSEFIGTSQDLDMDSVTDTKEKEEPAQEDEAKQVEEKVEEDDPFAINIVQRKERRRKKKPEPEDDDDDDDEEDDDDDDDDDDDEDDERPKKKAARRPVGRRAAPRKAPVRRRAVKKSDD